MMIERITKPTQYKDIEAGEVFEKGGNYYLAVLVFENEFESVNCVNLETGELHFFSDFDYVTRVKGCFKVE